IRVAAVDAHTGADDVVDAVVEGGGRLGVEVAVRPDGQLLREIEHEARVGRRRAEVPAVRVKALLEAQRGLAAHAEGITPRERGAVSLRRQVLQGAERQARVVHLADARADRDSDALIEDWDPAVRLRLIAAFELDRRAEDEDRDWREDDRGARGDLRGREL